MNGVLPEVESANKKRKREHKFRVEWKDEFGTWLQPHEINDNGLNCALCEINLMGGKTP